eukprot:Phypoly_transcript_15186.p1 GENE.Phypoly_transcript_15186~~Phypoly_transcript_15186.p1  ORF type:complete len:283 (+),score=51.62 Phypoly_transcript_15186:82-930(+)
MNTTEPTLAPTVDGYFGFKPIMGLQIAALVVYSLLTATVLGLNIWKRAWFMMAIVVGGALEIFAFAWRIWETSHYNSEAGYILYLVPVLVAPTVLAAANYALAASIMIKADVRVPIFTPKVTKWVFLVCDVAAFFIQGIGGSVAGAAKTVKTAQTGSNIILGGLAISLGVFVIFLILAAALHFKIRRQQHVRWMNIFYVVYVNMLCLSIRAVYRVVEFAQGDYHNKISDNETYFYVLDVLLMMILIASWIPFHPSFLGLSMRDEDESAVTPMGDKEMKSVSP